jgi:Family of unknown function (DUF6088)
LKKINVLKPGKIVFPTDFRGTGAESAIKMSLSRITNDGLLIRLAHGIYLVPQKGNKIAPAPALEEIAKAIAGRERVRILPSGSYALFKLGFVDKMPINIEYLTDGQPRKIHIAQNILIFKAITPKKFSLKGPLSSLLILAMEEIGQSGITDEIGKKIKDIMEKEDPAKLASDLQLAPAWIYNHLIKMKAN